MQLDLNCDLGEHEPPHRTAELMRHITSANVACGVHAGSLPILQRCAELALEHGVRLGAHPGPHSPTDRGRARIERADPERFEFEVLAQIATLEKTARSVNCAVRHVKLHGAWYHLSEASPEIAAAYVDLLRRGWPALIVYCLAGGAVAQAARAARLIVWEEAFLDRNYQANGALVPRGAPEALITDPAQIAERARAFREGRPIHAADGTLLHLSPQTLCLHSDTPNCTASAEAARAVLSGGTH